MFEAHFGIPISGAVLNTVNVRLNASTVGFLLEHSSSAIIMVDQELFKPAEEALKILKDR
ncbi:putative acid--thiol ligase [Helianthus anomalus]